MNNKQSTVLVLGGYGFIGRYTAHQLRKRGVNVLKGTRGNGKTLLPEDRRVLLQNMDHESTWQTTLIGVDVVINTVGILRERKNESFEDVHHRAVDTLATACKKRGIRFIHVSALGLDNPLSNQFALSKQRGEHAIMASDSDWYIVRPSLVDGADGYGARWFRKIARWPVHFTPSNAVGPIAPIRASELGEALTNLALRESRVDDEGSRTFEVSSGINYSVIDYLAALAGKSGTPHVRIPGWVVRCLVFCLDLIQLTPLSFGHYELLQFPNTPIVNHLPALLGRDPLPVAVCANRNGQRILSLNQDW